MNTVSSLLKLKDRQHQCVHTVSPDHMVLDAIRLMAEKNIGAVLVVSRGNIVGIISERDCTRRTDLVGRSPAGTFVREIMTHNVVTVEPHHTVDQCMNLMTNRRMRHLPVVDAGVVIGVLSIGDLVKAAIAAQATLIEKLQEYIRGESY